MAGKSGSNVGRTIDRLGDDVRHILFRNLKVRGSPVHAAHTVLRESTPSRAHDHDFYEFFLVKKGQLTEYRPGIKECHPTRTLVFVPPSRTHCFACAPGCPEALFINLAFPAALFNDLMKFLNNSGVRKRLLSGFAISDMPIMQWERLLRRADALLPGSGLNFKARDVIFKALMFDLSALTVEKEGDAGKTALPGWLSAACEAMREKENQRQGLARFIRLCGCTQEHATRTMKKLMKQTPTEFINELRLKRVADALSMTSSSITQSAYEAGFNNLAHFNALFRKEFGAPPREFRKMQGTKVVPRT